MASQLNEKLNWQVKHIDGLYRPSQERALELRALVKEMYDSLESKTTYGPLKSLIVDQLDADSIWEEIQTRNRPLLRSVRKKVSALRKHIEDVRRQKQQEEQEKESSEGDSEEDTDDGSSEGSSKDGVNIDKIKRDVKSAMVDQDSDEEEEDSSADSEESEEDEEEEDEEDIMKKRQKKKMKSNDNDEDEVDDDDDDDDDVDEDFIDDMNDFLDEEEDRYGELERKKEKLEEIMAHGGIAEDFDDNSEDDEDFVAREMYEEGEDDFDTETLKYEDFFKGAPTKGKGKGKDKDKGKKKKKTAAASLRDEEDKGSEISEEDDESEMDEGEGEDSHSDEEEPAKPLSKKEKRKAQRLQEIEEIERELVGKKSWDLQGEVQAKHRPENSLLEIHTDIEKALKPAPIITEEYTSSLEEMIIKRITESNFDDVVAPDLEKGPRKSDVNDFILSQDKSRQGLGEIYADEFMAKSARVEAKEGDDENITNIKGLFHKICRQLDALSHFHYTPRPIVEEGNVAKEALPSISLEDVTPTTESASSAFTNAAPETVHEKKRGRAAALVADAELTSDDKKRRRLASKATRRKLRQADDVKERALSNTGKSSAKYEKLKTDEILRNDKRVTVQRHSGDNTDYTKSSKLFTQLQDQVQQDIRTMASSSGKKLKRKAGDDEEKGPKRAWKL